MAGRGVSRGRGETRPTRTSTNGTNTLGNRGRCSFGSCVTARLPAIAQHREVESPGCFREAVARTGGAQVTFSRLVRAGVITVEAPGPGDGGISGHRTREFLEGRRCASEALRQLGSSDGTVPVGHARQPIWPSGVVGSITHCCGLTAASVAWRHAISGLGIDAEPAEPLPEGLHELIASSDEWTSYFSQLGAQPRTERLLFSAKESVFKATFPLYGEWLEFDDVTVFIERRTFTATVCLSNRTPLEITGRWSVDADHLRTAVTIPASPCLGSRAAHGAAQTRATPVIHSLRRGSVASRHSC